MTTISIELGWSVVVPFIVLAADGVTADPAYVVPPEDLTSVFPDSVRVSLVADPAGGPSRSFRADAIRRWLDEGKLRALHAGRELRIRRADLDELMLAGCRRKIELSPEALARALALEN